MPLQQSAISHVWFALIKCFFPHISRDSIIRVFWHAHKSWNLEIDIGNSWIISVGYLRLVVNMFQWITQWYLLEKHFYCISEFSKLKHLIVSSEVGVGAKFLVCSPVELCSVFPNVILLLQIFPQLSGKNDWAKVPELEHFSAWTCNFSWSCSSWPFWGCTEWFIFMLLSVDETKTLSLVKHFHIGPEISLCFYVCFQIFCSPHTHILIWFYSKSH